MKNIENLIGKRENLWKRYNRTKLEEVKSEILTDIFERLETMQNNLNNFDINMQKEKDNIRNY